MMTSNDGTASGAHGTTYESRLCIFLFLQGYIRDLKGFKLRFQAEGGDKFDDVVFDPGNGRYLMIQLKHKEKANSKITNSNLFTEHFNTPFNLIKYVKAVINLHSTQSLFKDKLDTAIVFTNISFDLKNDKLSLKSDQMHVKDWFDGFESIILTPITSATFTLLDMTTSVPDAKCFKFTDDPNIVQILQRQAVALAEDVGTLEEEEIREALDKLIFAVRQPNVEKITEIIKENIKAHFKLNDANLIYEKLEKHFRDWCMWKTPFGQPSTGTHSKDPKQHVLTFSVAETFFQKHVKIVSFGVIAPTDAFTGRVQELEEIKRRLQEKSSLIVSQTLTISGLGGIGKTQLTLQFIKQFGQSVFYGRIIWIDAESDESVKDSFKRLGQVLKIQDADKKETEVMIQEVFQYFKGLKVLFVLDNFDKSPINKGTLVTYCLDIASGLPKDDRPYFLITSRNQKCLPNIPLFDLNVLSLEDAVQLIKYEMIEEPKRNGKPPIINLTDDDTNELAEKLATTLERFPLALRQALAYIKQQSEQKRILGNQFEIKEYFDKFYEEKQELLSFDFPGNFGKNEKTTFITWNVTLDAIKADQVHGENAIKILRIFSYLNANKIDPKMFLCLFDDNEEQTTKALLLLEKYSMITRVGNVMTFYQMHRLVQTVVQLQFQNYVDKEALLEKTCELIYPELYKKTFSDSKENNADEVEYLMKKCSFDQLLHFNTLSIHMLKHDRLKSKYEDFFTDLNEKVLLQPIFNDDVDKIKALKMSTEYLRNIFENYIEEIMTRKPFKVIKYSIDVRAIKINEQLKGKSCIEWSEVKDNVDMFKFLIEEGADLSTVLEFITVDLVTEIRDGNSESLQTLTSDESKDIKNKLSECFFIATLFDQKSIVERLLKIESDLDLQYKAWPLTYVAVILGYKVLLEILLQKSDKQHLYKCLIKLVKDRSFTDAKTTEIILNKYIELGGDVTDIYSKEDESLSYARHRQPKKEVFQALSSFSTSGAAGTTYEARMCMSLFVRGFMRELKNFKLEYQVPDADKFDDIVFNDGSGMYQLIQFKYKENENQWKISNSNLFTEKFNTDFNLIKYVKAFINANSSQRFKDKINAAVVVTNINFDVKNDELNLIINQRPAATVWYNGLKSIQLKPTSLDGSAIFDMTDLVPDAKYYKFTDDPNIVQILMRQAVTLARDVGPLTEDEIREALDKIIFAVRQPNLTHLKKIIKDEIKDHFKLNDADLMFDMLDTRLRDWCDTKNPLELPTTSIQSNVPKQPILTYADADQIFQQHVKAVSFGVTAPTDAFTGRTEELEKIRQQLNKNHNLIASQTLIISGLGGIGKTQLVKQFIKEFGQSEFYGRIIWIQAESDETVKNSFERLAQVLNIQDARKKGIQVLIYEIFQNFAGLKVLFVFDKFDKSPANDELLVMHCRKTASGMTRNCRPYFLFTSRNRNCLPGVSLLDLNVLSPEEAVQLIRKELNEVNLTEADAEKLAEVLQYFPLALKQAITYIKQQQMIKQFFGERYEIQDYFTKFDKETQDLLDFEFFDEFGEKGKTTFITWNVTLDVIKSDEVHGKNAIKILSIVAYLYADKINPKIFVPLCENNEAQTNQALLLLERYSMITKVQEEDTTFYQIHRLVQMVVQLKFQKQEKSLQEQTFKLINPELHKEYFGSWFTKFLRTKTAERRKYLQDLLNKCSADQVLHYNTLSVHMQKHKSLVKKYGDFFSDLNDKILKDSTFSNNVEKLKAIKVTKEKLKRFIERHIDDLLQRLGDKSLIELLVKEYGSIELFKFLIEKGTDLSEVLEFASIELISEIIKGETDLLQTLINEKPKDYQSILNECLSFATIFNQELILQVLAQV